MSGWNRGQPLTRFQRAIVSREVVDGALWRASLSCGHTVILPATVSKRIECRLCRDANSFNSTHAREVQR